MSSATPNSDDFWDITNSIDLGSDHSYDLIYGDALWWEDHWPTKKWSSITRLTPEVGAPEILTAVVIWHRRPDNGEICGVLVHFARPLQKSEKALDYPIWEVKSFKPFEIMPSVICKTCGDHGWIRDGRWFGV
jgi:hypothetical protein